MIEGVQYLNIIKSLLEDIEMSQKNNFIKAGHIIENSLNNEGVLHVYSTGHSHIMMEEMFYRTGGIVPVDPIFDPPTMLHQGVLKSTELERLTGYAKILFDHHDLRKGESIIICSNSGINAVPIEAAMIAKEKGLNVIVITSVNISSNSKSRHSSGKKLMDIADIVIDNCIKGSDASIKIEETNQYVAPVSTIAGAYIVNRIVIEVVNKYRDKNKIPPVFMTANVEGGYEFNENLIKKYKERIRGF